MKITNVLLFFVIVVLISGCTIESAQNNNTLLPEVVSENQDVLEKEQKEATEIIPETEDEIITGIVNEVTMPEVSPKQERVPGESNCGDGYCQERSCMGLGCPRLETPESCPEDCGPDVKQERTIKNCDVNSDCITTGCSGQVCSNKERFSTCEILPWFRCLSKTQCLCVDNQCQWEQNDEYLDCLSGYNK